MRKRKLTSPLSWFFEPKITMVDLLGSSSICINEDSSPSVLSGKIISDITFTKPISNWSCREVNTWPMDCWFTVGKKILQVSKKEDIKFD